MSISIKKRFEAMFCFEYIASFWYQQEAQEPGLLYGRTEGEIYVSRGENVLSLSTHTAKFPELPTY
jgi:hypothetical protein